VSVNNTKNDDNGGVFLKIKALLERNRIGELLVIKGALTPRELRYALWRQKEHGEHLGKILIEQQLVSRRALYRALAQQVTVRCLAASFGLFLTFASFGVKSARAGSIKDVPAQMSLVSAANEAFAPINSYPPLFGTEERASSNLEPFNKWTGMFKRFETAMGQPHGREIITGWQNEIASFKGLPLDKMAAKVNNYINEQPYILDNRNWGVSDYWSTPVEFFDRGGDCEDFAIAKYVSLRALGVPEDRLRIAIVHDLQKDIPHAVLIVYTDNGALVLDNQSDTAEKASRVTRYRPIFTINRNAWWLHTKPGATPAVLASAE